jgi:hypothetical protein
MESHQGVFLPPDTRPLQSLERSLKPPGSHTTLEEQPFPEIFVSEPGGVNNTI